MTKSVGKPPISQQCGEANDGRGAAAERQLPGVLGRHDDVEEEPLLVRKDFGDCEIALDRVWIEEMLRCLHNTGGRVLEQTQRARDEIENGTKSASSTAMKSGGDGNSGEVPNRMIDVAGLGVRIVGPGEIVAAFLSAEIAQPEHVARRRAPKP